MTEAGKRRRRDAGSDRLATRKAGLLHALQGEARRPLLPRLRPGLGSRRDGGRRLALAVAAPRAHAARLAAAPGPADVRAPARRTHPFHSAVHVVPQHGGGVLPAFDGDGLSRQDVRRERFDPPSRAVDRSPRRARGRVEGGLPRANRAPLPGHVHAVARIDQPPRLHTAHEARVPPRMDRLARTVHTGAALPRLHLHWLARDHGARACPVGRGAGCAFAHRELRVVRFDRRVRGSPSPPAACSRIRGPGRSARRWPSCSSASSSTRRCSSPRSCSRSPSHDDATHRAAVRARPHAAHRHPARQPRHARCAHAKSGAALSRAVPVRSARHRDSRDRMEAVAAWRDPQRAAGAVGEALPVDLDQGRLAAARAQPEAALAADGIPRPAAQARRLSRGPVPGRARHALRQSEHRRRARQAARGAMRKDPRAAAVSAICGEHHRLVVRRRRRALRERAQVAGAALRRDVPCRRRLHPGAGADRERLLGEERAAGQARAVVPRRAAPHARARRPVSLLLPHDGAAARPRARLAPGRNGRSRSSRVSAGRSG